MAKCPTCGAPVNLAPDGDPKYEPPLLAHRRKIPNSEIGPRLDKVREQLADWPAPEGLYTEEMVDMLIIAAADDYKAAMEQG